MLHRAFVLARFDHVVTALQAQHEGLSVAQLYPLAIYRQHFWRGIWLLQASPPIPHVFMKLALLLAPWPAGVTRLLCAFGGAISIATACLLFGIVRRVTGSAVAALGLSLWFLLSTDLVVMEYDFFGQAFYENLGMLLVTACCALTPRVAPPRGLRAAGLLGGLAALAALTRASLSYYALVPLVLIAGRGRAWRMAAYLAPLLLLHGGWAIKTAALYGHFGAETSSWSGLNAADGLAKAGQLPDLCRDILASPKSDYPDWFVPVAARCPIPFIAFLVAPMPPQVRAADDRMTAQLGGINNITNSLTNSMVSRQYARAVTKFTLAHPGAFLMRFGQAYRLLWQRIADYGAMFYDPLFVAPVPRDFPGLLQRGFGETQLAMTSRVPQAFTPPPPISRPAWFGTISLAPLDALSIVALHVLFPLLAAADLWRRLRRRDPLLPPGSWILAGTVAYGLFVFCAVDIGENMRFRLAIEPAIIGLTAACLAVPARLLRGMVRARWRGAAGEPPRA